MTMYQLLCYVNVPAPADTCLTRTADRAILDVVPVMKRTVVFIIKYDTITSRNLGQYRYAIATDTRLYILFTIFNREATGSGCGNGGHF